MGEGDPDFQGSGGSSLLLLLEDLMFAVLYISGLMCGRLDVAL